MRIFVIFCLFLISAAGAYCGGAADSSPQYFVKGFQFYARGDYPAAAEMFRQVSPEDAKLYPSALYYLGCIAANGGDENAYALFEKAARLADNQQERQRALVQYARFCFANSKFMQYLDFAKNFAADSDSESAFNYAYALLKSGQTDAAAADFKALLNAGIDSPLALGVDMYIDALKTDKKFAAAIDNLKDKIDISKLSAKTDCGKARLDIMHGGKIEYPQAGLSLYAQSVLAEQSPNLANVEMLANAAYKFRDSTLAWRAMAALGKIYLERGDIKNAEICARETLRLSAPESLGYWRGCILLGDCQRLSKNYEAAQSEYQKVFMNRHARGEVLAESLYKCGLSWFEQGKWAEAHAYFQRVFVAFFRYEYWGSRAYYYDAQALYSLKQRRDANATLLEYFKRAKDRKSEIYKAARKYYNEI